MRALLLLVLASCTHDLAVYDRITVKPARDLDILYVFDDSFDRGSFAKMASQLDVLQARLMDVDGQLPDLHVGVTTTDLGTRGAKDPLARPAFDNCAGDGNAARLVSFGSGIPSRGYLEDLRGPDGTRDRNYGSGELGLELARLTNPAPGTANTGCDFVQPLEAMRRALDPFTNPDFIRPNALLSVVFLTNDDDCSMARGAMLDPNNAALGPLSTFRCVEQGVICDGDADPRSPGVRTNCRPREGSQFMVDVSEYTKFLQQYKADPRDVTVSAVVGARDPFEVRNVGVPWVAPSCQGAVGAAKPAVRLGSFVDSLGGVIVDACTQEAAYEKITAPILNRQRSCFPDLRQDDGEDCVVTETILNGGGQTEFPRCADGGGGPTPCWYTYADQAACPGGDHVGIAIRRGNTTAPARSRVEATCFVK
ncbi:MAG TPA: hypothetical protein VNO30_05525 [Kofleriaceae bacterium]|nr:hypothetical protein [Kofleriaceae bacterium]